MLREEGLATEHWQQAKFQELQKELGKAGEKVSQMEEDNRELRSSRSAYRLQWINAAREVELMLRSHNGPSLSQADWMSSSPVRSCGLYLDLTPENDC
jgi:hypothetical protein